VRRKEFKLGGATGKDAQDEDFYARRKEETGKMGIKQLRDRLVKNIVGGMLKADPFVASSQPEEEEGKKKSRKGAE